MTTFVKRPDALASAIFCDDVRQEIDGKASYIGVYRGKMIVHDEFPTRLPKFAIAVEFRQRKAIFRGDIRVHVFLPGEDKPFFNESLRSDPDKPFPNTSPAHNVVVTRANLIFAPLNLERTGLLKVRIVSNEHTYPAGTLRISSPRDNGLEDDSDSDPSESIPASEA